MRGHRDNLTDIERDPEDTIGHGNFWALLQFRIGSGDQVLAKHLDTATRNATYTSADVQNQLLAIIGDHIQGQILSRVAKAVFFTFIADKVTDISNKEQLSIVLRYVLYEYTCPITCTCTFLSVIYMLTLMVLCVKILLGLWSVMRELLVLP